jgi:uncharacterized protein
LIAVISVIYLVVGESILMPTLVVASWTPNVSAFVTLGLIVRRKRGIRELIRRLVRVKISAIGYVLVSANVAVVGLSILIYLISGGEMSKAATFRIGALLSMIPILLITGATGDELGWRGFMLSELQKRWPGLLSALIIAPLWVALHIPLWLRPEFGYSGVPFAAFAVSTVALSVTMAYIVNRSNGSLFGVTLSHFLQNFGLAFCPALGIAPARFFAIYATLNVVYAVIIIAVDGRGFGKLTA